MRSRGERSLATCGPFAVTTSDGTGNIHHITGARGATPPADSLIRGLITAAATSDVVPHALLLVGAAPHDGGARRPHSVSVVFLP